MRRLVALRRFARLTFFLLLAALLLGGSTLPPADQTERVRAFTRGIEFDYVQWTLDAIGLKLDQSALGTSTYIPDQKQRQLVLEYLRLVQSIQKEEAQLNDIFADPQISDPQAASQQVRRQLDEMRARRGLIGPLAESILQSQVSAVAASYGLTLGGQPLPPVLFHSTPLPLALIVSPRNAIRQDEDISLVPDLSIDQRAALEDKVDRALDVSSLVVPVGGIGVYPTMVQQSDDLNWLSEVIAHEWTHNFLTLRPLGLSYMSSPELRTMNETTAAIAGKELGRVVIERFYPELLPPEPPPAQTAPTQVAPSQPAFDFRAEMRLTRVTVDRLLAEGKVVEAESYMEQRRIFFWDHGYHIRKLNQAYFAFYGAYADQPGGAAGEDPVGAAVRSLRADSPTLADFIHQISWMWSFDQLQKAVAQASP